MTIRLWDSPITFSCYLLHFLLQSQSARFYGSWQQCWFLNIPVYILVHKANRHLKRHQISASLVVLVAALDQGELLPIVYLCRGLCCRANLTHFFIRWCDTAVPPSVGWPPIHRPAQNLYMQNSKENGRIGTHIIHKVPSPSLACLLNIWANCIMFSATDKSVALSVNLTFYHVWIYCTECTKSPSGPPGPLLTKLVSLYAKSCNCKYEKRCIC